MIASHDKKKSVLNLRRTSVTVELTEVKERRDVAMENGVVLLQLFLILLLVAADELLVSLEGVVTPEKSKQIVKTMLAISTFSSTHFLSKSLKTRRSLFWCLVGVLQLAGSRSSLRKTLAISSGPWLTVVPMQPCKTICKIFGSGGSCFVAASSSWIFF